MRSTKLEVILCLWQRQAHGQASCWFWSVLEPGHSNANTAQQWGQSWWHSRTGELPAGCTVQAAPTRLWKGKGLYKASNPMYLHSWAQPHTAHSFWQSNSRLKFKMLRFHHLFLHYTTYINLSEYYEHMVFSKSKGKCHFQGSHIPHFGQWILYFFSFHVRIWSKSLLKTSEKRQSFLPIFSSLINRIDLLSQPACGKEGEKRNKSKNYKDYTANDISKSIDKIEVLKSLKIHLL